VPSSSAALAAALADSDGEAASWAARALGVLGDPAALPGLARALERREPGVRTLAANAIAQIEEKHAAGAPSLPSGSVGRLVALARDSSPSVAISALSALRWFAGDREAYRSIHAQAVSGAGRRRVVAFLAEAAALGDRSRSRLEEASGSPDVAMRVAAASAVAFLSEPVAAALRPIFIKDASPRVREAAVGALPLDAGGRPDLVAMLGDPDAGVRSAAMDRLAESNDPAVLSPIAASFDAFRSDPIPDAELSAVRAAGRLKTDAGRALLEKAAASPRGLVAREACGALDEAFGEARPLPSYSTGRTLADYERLVDAEERPTRAIVRTVRGSFTIALDRASAPLTVDNFETLSRKKFFDDTAFDRVVPWFVIQGGDPTGTLHGGPGYEIRDELVEAPYEAGAVGMGLEGPDTGGSQWFVTLSAQPHLDGRYPRFGRIVEGQEVVERIEQGDRVLSITIVQAP